MKSVFFICALFLVSFFAQAQTAGLDSAAVIQKDQLFTLAPAENLSVKGQVDAEKNYKKYKGAATGTLIASLVSPLVGLIPAIITSSTTPKLENLGYPDENLFKQADYHNAYTKKAKRIKSGKVWKNWGIGFGVNLVLVLVIAAGQ
ncbi:hypothetical protein SAMN04487996_107141 [Dyadobacter soli]|uniref:Uncharacterized protein n=1 Tax=Dyadobacter soli TaxID=659014 RepID=A0A1G7G6B0_9BACT|nr:hypothetical protein [Dyadobacter soli]SDE83684.1 hypothetical protein SAMN04487996_107141 [Dyadobacter soli]